MINVCQAGTSVYYVSPSGSNSNPGTLNLPFRTVKYAISKLAAGGTLYVRGGTYYEGGITIGAAGTSTSHISIQNYPGEYPIIDGGIQDFRKVGNSDWEVYDATNDIYRSVKTYPSAGQVYGYFGPDNGSYPLVPYQTYTDLSTDNEDYTTTASTGIYAGPGVFWNSSDQRIYVRLKHSYIETAQGVSVPANLDPRQNALFIVPSSANLLSFSGSAAYIDWEGVSLEYMSRLINFSAGAHNITFKDFSTIGGQYPIVGYAVVHDLTFDGLSMKGPTPPWVTWTDVKTGLAPLHDLQGDAFDFANNGSYNITITYCTANGMFDILNGGASHDVWVTHNTFNRVRDDVIDVWAGTYNMEVAYNTVIGANAGGMSWTGGGPGQPPAGKIGARYLHHNVIDTTIQQQYGRRDPNNLLDNKYDGPTKNGMSGGEVCGHHSMTAYTGPDPFKIYHNTFVLAPSVDGNGSGCSYPTSLPADTATDQLHEVYNNIFIQTGDKMIFRDQRVDNTSQVYDGNLYYKPGTNTSGMFAYVENWTSAHTYSSLWVFMSSSDEAFTKHYYAPGWERSSLQANPQLDGNYRPSATGPAATGAIDLTSKDWPGAGAESYRGALAPM